MIKNLSNHLIQKILPRRYLDPDFEKRGARTRKEIDLFWQDHHRIADYLVKGRLDFFKEVVRKMPYRKSIKKVIDVGCGSGHILYYYLKKHKLDQRFAVANDISVHALVQVSKLMPNCNLIRADFGELGSLMPGHFDLAIATEVLEHLEQPAKYMRSLIRLLNKNGLLVITIPDGNVDNWEGHTNFWNIIQFKNFLSQFKNLTLLSAKHLSSGELMFVTKRSKR